MVRAGGVQGSQFGRADITGWVTPMSDDSRSAANGLEHVAPQVDLPGRDGFTPENRAEPELDHEDANQAAEQILGANPLIGFDRAELIDAFQRLVKLLVMDPRVVLREQLNFSRELLKISTGNSQLAPDPKDRRFSHEVWQKNGFYKRLMQAFLAWRQSMQNALEQANASADDRERARFALSLISRGCVRVCASVSTAWAVREGN